MQVGLWVEGTSNKFHLEVEYIAATNTNTNVKSKERIGENICQTDIVNQDNLKFNVSNRYDSTGLPFTMAENENLVEAVCCDSAFLDYAEPINLFERPDINLFDNLNEKNIFFDPVCQIPLFRIPMNRTIEEFKSETIEHGWPSFRDEEVYQENIIIKDKTVYSTCGPHLGSFDKDEKGNRYCINLVCISGNGHKEAIF